MMDGLENGIITLLSSFINEIQTLGDCIKDSLRYSCEDIML